MAINIRKIGLLFAPALLLLLSGLAAVLFLSPARRTAAVGDILGPADTGALIGSGFTYQGRLMDSGRPADGRYDMVFKLFDAPEEGRQLFTVVDKEDVMVSEGLFTVNLDFGDVFNGNAFWLQIEVRPGNAEGAFTVLAPRQPLSAVPYALGLNPQTVLHSSGVEVQHAQANGFFVCSTGDEITCDPSGFSNGLEVGNADHYGLYIGDSGRDAIYIDSSGEDGIVIRDPTDNGIWIRNPGEAGVSVSGARGRGVSASTVEDSVAAGRFVNLADNSGLGKGLYARGNQGQAADIVLGGNDNSISGDDGVITSDPQFADSDIRLFTMDNLWIDLDEQSSNSNSNFNIRNSDDESVWMVDEKGNVSNRGSQSTLVEVETGEGVQLYAVQSSGNWFEDFGSGTLLKGQAAVPIEATFAATVNLEAGYHVYLTPLGDCALFVAEKGIDSFQVQALDGASCSIDFDYRLVAKRSGYEEQRLEPAELHGGEQ